MKILKFVFGSGSLLLAKKYKRMLNFWGNKKGKKLSYFVYNQIWLHFPMDDCHFGHVTKSTRPRPLPNPPKKKHTHTHTHSFVPM